MTKILGDLQDGSPLLGAKHPREVGTKLVLLRHGRTDWNDTGRFQGSSDVALNQMGLDQARRAAPAVYSYGIDAIYASPLSRALETARPVAQLAGLTIATDPRLQEIDTGLWEGLTIDEIDERDPLFRTFLRSGRDRRRSATGETAEETGIRVANALHDISAAQAGKTILVVSHGLAIRAGVAMFLGLGMDGFWALGDVGNCNWVVLGWQWERWRIIEYGANANGFS